MPQEIRNLALYADRTVQDWHRATFGADAWAIDIDLMGACRRCKQSLYLIESTTNPDKSTAILAVLAAAASVPAILVRHANAAIVRATWVWPTPRLRIGGEQELIDALSALRESHECGAAA